MLLRPVLLGVAQPAPPTDGRKNKDILNFKIVKKILKSKYASSWIKQLGCHSVRQEVSRCHTRGESEKSIVWSTLALKPGTDVTRNPNQEESIVHRQQSRQAKVSTQALKPRGDVNKSPKQGSKSVVLQEGFMSSEN